MKYLTTLAVSVMALSVSAAAETRNLSGFESVSAEDRLQVEVATGAYSVQITGADASRVRTQINGDSLKISQRNRPWFGETPRLDAVVRITMPRVDGLSASRGAELSASGIEARNVSLSASMGGELRVVGTCGTVTAAASMGGVIRAEDFHCERADVSASMGGEARVYASETYEGSASMGGAINISGDGASNGRATAMGGTIND